MSRAAVFGSTSCSFICPAEPGAVLSAADNESVETVLSASSLFCFRLIFLTIRKTIKGKKHCFHIFFFCLSLTVFVCSNSTRFRQWREKAFVQEMCPTAQYHRTHLILSYPLAFFLRGFHFLINRIRIAISMSVVTMREDMTIQLIGSFSVVSVLPLSSSTGFCSSYR